MKRSEIATSKMGHLTVCLKEDVDKYIDKLESAFLKIVHDEFGHDQNANSEEEIEDLVEWALRR